MNQLSKFVLARQVHACYTNINIGHITRGDQKVLQFSMMYKWHRQNNYIILM